MYISQVVLGGGQDASAVTTTDHRAGKFEAKFHDKVSYRIECQLNDKMSLCCLVSSVLDGLRISFV